MSNEEMRNRLYTLNTSNKSIRKKMMRSLKLTSEGEYDRAARLFDESRQELQRVKQEHSSLRKEMKRVHADEAERSISFSEALQATVAQANALQSKQCSAVKFHIYN